MRLQVCAFCFWVDWIPVVSGQELMPGELYCTSGQASHLAETPWGQSHAGGSSQISRRWHTPPVKHQRLRCVGRGHRGDGTRLGVSTYLHNLRVIQPLAQNLLYEGKNLLQNDHHLKAQERMWREHSHWKSKEKWQLTGKQSLTFVLNRSAAELQSLKLMF